MNYLSIERKWIISCLQGNIDPSSNIDLCEALNICLYDGVAPFLYSTLKRYYSSNHNDIFFSFFVQNLKAHYILTKTKNKAYLEEIANIFFLLNNNGVKPILLKGSALIVSNTYKDVAHRPINDIDFFVSPDDMDNVHNILIDLGYKLNSIEHRSATRLIDGKRSYYKGDIFLDVHFPSMVLSIYKNDLKKTPIIVCYNGKIFFIPPPELLILHIIHHFIFSHFYMRLIWLIDISKLVERYDINWDFLYQRINSYRFNDIFFNVLKKVKDFFYAPIPDFITSRRDCFAFTLLLEPRDNAFLASIIKLLNINSILDRFIYVFSIFFPSRDFIIIRYSNKSVFLFRVFRPILMLLKIIRDLFILIF